MAAEDEIIDGTVANQIALRRFISREVRLMLQLFERFDRQLSGLLRRSLRKGMQVGSEAFKELLQKIRKLRADMMSSATKSVRATLKGVSEVESDKEWELLLAALALTQNKPARAGIQDILNTPFAVSAAAASTLTEWLRALRAVDFRRIRDSLTQGVKEERTKDEIVAGVVGTRDQQFRNGQVAVTRRNIAALVTTAIVHVSATSREALWGGIPAVVGMLWTSILDTRTSAICRARDNKVVMFGRNRPPEGTQLLDPPGARPPAHPHCRSSMMALIRGMVLGRLTFDQWLRRQNKDIQDDILGKAKGEMFRRGQVTLDEFVDNSGKEFNLEQLRAA